MTSDNELDTLPTNSDVESPEPDEKWDTIKSGDVYLTIWLKNGSFGPFLQPGKPVFRYKNKDDKVCYSEYLRDRDCLHASNCFHLAHNLIENWRRTQRTETKKQAA